VSREKLNLAEEFSDVKIEEAEAADYFLARQIMQEIVSFGINQRTTVKLIELLALELEDREKMLGVVAAIKGQPSSPGSAILEK